ncbi:zinc finger SWIM domain-containing protein 7 [Phascolarctos cinereus]|uniref:Zinc finger SWIM domain-containing protein 7 isoform X1 n=1 Tax=Phascolarctos cinereus TaxID=38626 RepID=A0A6P5LVW4_PHACI|nr:zinc finger SWIM domain-containing protein 7 isoform X1 [Phascolarctos cinereus]XP_020862703.1 zinc finger SWIM domain-containing protein 7 isoform X1 [Phascolarctos cinereus]XP_020862704.1 zinc finger SWIM domain-containing protein 7 isoform X1 [Phascolarctos cinereus]XP_020862705.1 zinc finger SWIM domain-containing protein 7 isoform X1 [Phascolarctos cinereus]
MTATLPTVLEEILGEIAATCGEASEVPDELLLALKFIFGPSAIQALDLVDRRSVTRVSSPSGRTIYQVLGSSGKVYVCFASCHYCSCPAFAFSVLRKSDSLLCKHLLATYLSLATGLCQDLSVSNEQLSGLLLAEEDQEQA